MKNIARTPLVAVVAAVMLVTGCATSSDSTMVYKQGQMRQAQLVRFGTVVSVIPVRMEGSNNELMTLGGAALGGMAGNQIGQGRGSTAGAIVGALAGGAAAMAAQRQLGGKNALQITIRLDEGYGAHQSNVISIVQEADVPFVPGQRVQVLSGGGTDRVMPM